MPDTRRSTWRGCQARDCSHGELLFAARTLPPQKIPHSLKSSLCVRGLSVSGALGSTYTLALSVTGAHLTKPASGGAAGLIVAFSTQQSSIQLPPAESPVAALH